VIVKIASEEVEVDVVELIATNARQQQALQDLRSWANARFVASSSESQYVNAVVSNALK